MSECKTISNCPRNSGESEFLSLLFKKKLCFTCDMLAHFSYKHALDGVIRVSREEGILKLFNGWNWASSRAVMVTVGQLCFYDVIKAYLLTTPYFKDNLTTHFTSSLGAVSWKILLRWCSFHMFFFMFVQVNVSWEILCIVSC